MMYRPPAFVIDDPAVLHDVLRHRVFVTLAAVRDGEAAFAYAPVVVDEGGVRFHLASGNPLAALEDGARIAISCVAGDAYISPDWYETKGRVPTWNYIAVEGRGAVRRLDAEKLRQLLVDVSASEENKLLPKPPWTIDKVPEEKTAALLNAIVGFSLRFETLEGKFKLSQNVTPEDFDGVRCGLAERGDPASAAIAEHMRGVMR
jgi:transcriptional regulator